MDLLAVEWAAGAVFVAALGLIASIIIGDRRRKHRGTASPESSNSED